MVELTDYTLVQTKGDFQETCTVMNHGDWMLRSNVFVTNPFMSAKYILHFWSDGKVTIFEADRPTQEGASDEDIRELSEWCKISGWKSLHLDDRLLVDRSTQAWWNRVFLSGLIESQKLREKEDQEMKRLSQAFVKEQEEEE